MEEEDSEIILFDGLCNLCHGTMCFIAARDSDKCFKYEFLQSEKGQFFMKEYGLLSEEGKGDDLKTVILISGNNAYQKSTAMLRILRRLDGLWPFLYVFIIVPRPLRDFLYGFIGKRRYRWFGKQETCKVPGKDVKERFLGN